MYIISLVCPAYLLKNVNIRRIITNFLTINRVSLFYILYKGIFEAGSYFVMEKINNSFSQIRLAKTQIQSTEHKQPAKKSGYSRSTAMGFSAASPVATREGLGQKVLNSIDWFQKRLERGGFFAEFLVVDLLGMIIPRTAQAYLRNRQELGHLNHKAGREEAIREFLTGPSMFILPMAFLACSGRMFGRSSLIRHKLLGKFKEVAISVKNSAENKGKITVGKFYDELVKKLYGTALGEGKEGERKREDISKLFQKLHNAHMESGEQNKGFVSGVLSDFIGFFRRKEPKKVAKAREELLEKLEKTNKNLSNPDRLGISVAEPAKMNFLAGSKPVSIENIVEDSMNYSTDIVEKVESNPDILDKIHAFKEGARKLLTTTAFATLAGFLYSIPTFYKQNKQFPGIDGLTDSKAANDNRMKKGHAA